MQYSVLDNTLKTIGLDRELFRQGTLSAKEISLEAETIAFQSGDPCGAFLIIKSGQLRVEMTAKSGREILLYRMHENDTCIITTSVLLNHENYYARAITETPVTAIAIPAADFHKALTLSHDFNRYILSGYSQRIAALIKLLDKIASKDITYELNELLLRHVDSENTVKLTQKEIAKEIGTAREVISRKLSILDEQKILNVQRGKILILNIEYLRRETSI